MPTTRETDATGPLAPVPPGHPHAIALEELASQAQSAARTAADLRTMYGRDKGTHADARAASLRASYTALLDAGRDAARYRWLRDRVQGTAPTNPDEPAGVLNRLPIGDVRLIGGWTICAVELGADWTWDGKTLDDALDTAMAHAAALPTPDARAAEATDHA